MRNKFFILIAILAMFLTGCELLVDKDTTGNISIVSTKPVITVLGEPIISMKVGDAYTEAGVSVSVGDSLDYDWEIAEGAPNANQKGYYVVTYKSTNGFKWISYAYRAVLVHDGTPYSTDISGVYLFNNILDPVTISKYSIDGYWQMDNVWGEEGVILPIIFADLDDGNNYGIVPGEHPTKGLYFGTAKRITNTKYQFTIKTISKNGIETIKDFLWIKN